MGEKKGSKKNTKNTKKYMSKQRKLLLPRTLTSFLDVETAEPAVRSSEASVTKPLKRVVSGRLLLGSATVPEKKFKTVSKTSFNGKVGVFAGKVGKSTIAVDVIDRYTHRRYGKVFSRIKRCKVHVEESICESLQKGDKITMHTCRPLSRTKKLAFHPEKDRLQKLTKPKRKVTPLILLPPFEKKKKKKKKKK